MTALTAVDKKRGGREAEEGGGDCEKKTMLLLFIPAGNLHAMF